MSREAAGAVEAYSWPAQVFTNNKAEGMQQHLQQLTLSCTKYYNISILWFQELFISLYITIICIKILTIVVYKMLTYQTFRINHLKKCKHHYFYSKKRHPHGNAVTMTNIEKGKKC